MRKVSQFLLVASLVFLIGGCTKVAKFDGPTVDAFHGQLVSKGNPVSLSEDQVVKLFLVHKGSGERFRIPIKPDGTFDIGWMPIGEFNCSLEEKKRGIEAQVLDLRKKFKPVPGGLRIEEGKTEYEIEIGEDF